LNNICVTGYMTTMTSLHLIIAIIHAMHNNNNNNNNKPYLFNNFSSMTNYILL